MYEVMQILGEETGRPLPVDWNEAVKVANSIKIMNLKRKATSVDRDDLKDDMGSKFWVETVKNKRTKSWYHY